MSIYATAAATSLRLLTKCGRSVTVRKQTAGAYDPATSSATITTTDYAAKGAVFDFKSIQYGTVFASGSTIQQGDKRALVAPSGITVAPVPNDLLIVGTDTWTILNVRTLNPAGTTVLYELHLRK